MALIKRVTYEKDRTFKVNLPPENPFNESIQPHEWNMATDIYISENGGVVSLASMVKYHGQDVQYYEDMLPVFLAFGYLTEIEGEL